MENTALEPEATLKWTDEEEDELVELWEERPCLYLISSPEYADRVKKSKAAQFKEILLNTPSSCLSSIQSFTHFLRLMRK